MPFPNINTNYRIDNEINKRAMNFFRTLRINNIKEFLEMFDFKGDYSKVLNELGISWNNSFRLYYTKRIKFWRNL